MALVFDRVKVVSPTTGTGSLTLGAADAGFRTFAQAGAADGQTVNYVIEDGSNWEIGTGQLGGGGTVLNRTPLQSSNGNAAINLSGGARVFSALTKADLDAKSDVGHTHNYLSSYGGSIAGNLAITDSNLSILTLNGGAGVAGKTDYDIRQGIVGVNNGGFSIYDRNAGATRFSIDPVGIVSIPGALQTPRVQAPNFHDNHGQFNVNLGNGTVEGRGLVAGFSGGNYGGIGYNVRFTTGTSNWVAPLGDTSSLLIFASGGLQLHGWGDGPAGRTLSGRRIMEIDRDGNQVNEGSISAGPGGFKQTSYSVGVRNPIWRFGNADAYGISYFQGGSSISGTFDTIGFHFGTPTAAGSVLQISNHAGNVVNVNGDLQVGGRSVMSRKLTFNNSGQAHGTWNDANAVPLEVGTHFLQATTNGPGTGAGQYYLLNMGLGSDYEFSSYGVQIAIPRTTTTGDNYMSMRFREAGGWSGWNKVNAGRADGLMPGAVVAENITFTNLRGQLVGQYDPGQTQGIWAMGDAYKLPIGGGTTNYGQHYGLAWSYEPSYPNNGDNPQSKGGLSHQLLIQHAGVTQTAIGRGIWTGGSLTVLENIYANGNTTKPLRPDRLYRRDANNAYSLQNHWTGNHWHLRGYFEDDYHAEVRVGYADSAGNVQGYGIAEGPSGNTLALRSANGYLFSLYFNQSSGNDENPGISQVMVTNGSDGYFRKASLQHFAGQLFQQLNYISGVHRFNSSGFSLATANPPLQAYSADGSGAFMAFHRGANYAINMGLDSGNVFRIGGWSASVNLFSMDMSGNLTMTGDVTAFSDERLKTNVRTVDDALALVSQMRGVRFTKDGREGVGVIAQEMQRVLPEVVHTATDEMQTLSVAYGNVVGVLIEAIKELQERLDKAGL